MRPIRSAPWVVKANSFAERALQQQLDRSALAVARAVAEAKARGRQVGVRKLTERDAEKLIRGVVELPVYESELPGLIARSTSEEIKALQPVGLDERADAAADAFAEETTSAALSECASEIRKAFAGTTYTLGRDEAKGYAALGALHQLAGKRVRPPWEIGIGTVAQKPARPGKAAKLLARARGEH